MALLELVLLIPAFSKVQGGAPSFPLHSVAIKFATDYLLLNSDLFLNVAFVSSNFYLSLNNFQRKYITVFGEPSVGISRRTRITANNQMWS